LVSLWVGAIALLLAVVPVAIYASTLNEFTDRAADAAAGKRNRAGDSPRAVAALLAVALSIGFVFVWLWRRDTPLLSCYLISWLAFALYSIPPFRLKKRGFLGALCDASGEQMLPTLVAIFVACRYANREVSYTWLVSVSAWALAYGLRSIIWHQLTDAENDRAGGLWTFARRHPRGAPVFGTFVIFPIELATLAAMLWQVSTPWPPLFVALYVLYAIRISRRSRTSPVIVAPKRRFFIVLEEFYSHFFPVALLIAAAMRDRRDLAVLVIHLLLFPRRAFQVTARVVSRIRSSISNRRVNASTANTVVSASEPHHGGLG
jgi:1,4-dihydroxy-2-naphthoate octaprenyltransferase